VFCVGTPLRRTALYDETFDGEVKAFFQKNQKFRKIKTKDIDLQHLILKNKGPTKKLVFYCPNHYPPPQ
jgi:hypothetical protein